MRRISLNGPLTFPDSPRSELDRALGELVTLANDVLTTESRLRALLRANEAIVQQLDLPVVLRRIIEVAVDLVGAQYGALGVIDAQGGLEQFIHVGVSPEQATEIGHLPEGHGLLGALIKDPHPIRLAHLDADPRSAGFPAHHPAMETFLGVPVRVRDEVYGNLYLTNRLAGDFTADDEQLLTALAATAGFAIDNARLFAETKRRQAWAAASAEITAALLDATAPDSLVLVASRVLNLADADLVFVAVRGVEEGILTITTVIGDASDELAGSLIPIDGTADESVLGGRTPRLIDEGDAALAYSDRGFGPALALPLRAAGEMLGALIVSRNPGRTPFTPADLEMASDFAAQASLSIELGRVRSDQQRGLLLEDRSRIARDLHDHVIQQLFATGLELQNAVSVIPDAPTAGRVDGAISMIDAAISQIRTAVFALGNGRGDTVRHRVVTIVDELAGSLGSTPRLTFIGPVDLVITDTLADDVLAVVREGLSNVVKHAQADQVSVTVTVVGSEASVEVVDNGVGLSGGTRRSGVSNLEERARLRSGSSSLSVADGRTRLMWTVPLAELGAGS